jgi:hypothetical protein
LTEISHWPTFPGNPEGPESWPGKPNHIGILPRGPLLKRVPGGNI